VAEAFVKDRDVMALLATPEAEAPVQAVRAAERRLLRRLMMRATMAWLAGLFRAVAGLRAPFFARAAFVRSESKHQGGQ